MNGFETTRPPIVVLVGSSRFQAAFRLAEQSLARAGEIVLSLPDLPCYEQTDVAVESFKQGLCNLRREQIYLASLFPHRRSYVFVVNPDGIVGDTTHDMIEYAKSRGLQVKYMVDPPIRMTARHPSDKVKAHRVAA